MVDRLRVQLTSSTFSGNIYCDCRSLLSIVSTITHSLQTHCRYEHYACVSYFWGRIRTRFGGGEGVEAMKVYNPKADQFLHSYVSLRNNFIDRMRSTVVLSCKRVRFHVKCKRKFPNLVLNPLSVRPVVNYYPCKRQKPCGPYHFSTSPYPIFLLCKWFSVVLAL